MKITQQNIETLNTSSELSIPLIYPTRTISLFLYFQLKFHTKNDDLEKFYDTVIPRSSLPPDFGGTAPDTQTLHKKCMQTLLTLEPYFRAEEEQRIAALPDKKRDKAMERAFKNLDID